MYSNKDLFLEPTVSQYGNHMVMTNVEKDTKRKYLNIDTRFRDDYNDTSRTSHIENIITLPETITDVKSIMICNAEIPISYYNISSSLGNNAFGLIYDISYAGLPSLVPSGVIAGITYPIILNDGIYDVSGLQFEINYQLQNYKLINFGIDVSFSSSNIIDSASGSFPNSNSYLFSYSLFTSKSARASIQFAIQGNYLCNGTTASGDFDKYDLKTKLGWLLGYRKLSLYKISGLTVATGAVKSESIIDLNGPRYLFIVVDEFSKGNQNSFLSPLSNSIINKNILSRLNYDTKIHPFGSILSASIITGTLLSDRRSYTGKIDLQKLKVQLVNEYGKPVNLNGLDFSFCLEIEHE